MSPNQGFVRQRGLQVPKFPAGSKALFFGGPPAAVLGRWTVTGDAWPQSRKHGRNQAFGEKACGPLGSLTLKEHVRLRVIVCRTFFLEKKLFICSDTGVSLTRVW